MRKQSILGAIGIFLVLASVIQVVFAGVAPNKGADISASRVSAAAKANANINAAFNRNAPVVSCATIVYGSLPDAQIITGGSSISVSESYCGWIMIG